jgi:SAM-dependent methyltransferase
MTSSPRPCWCGETAREPLGDDYARCGGCGTLVYDRPYSPEDYRSPDGETGFYGRAYWERHVPHVLGMPGLAERARTDPPDRAVYYLRRILEHVAPGSSVLEVGCAPGSLTYLLEHAGFAAVGLEIAQATVDFARERFGVPVRRGPIEEAGTPGGFDAIVAIDVLEHLTHPLETLAACARGLRGPGLLLLQTPCYRGEGADWEMLVPREHLYLYAEDSIRRLLGAAGFAAVEVSASLYAHDMWVAAAREAPLTRRSDPEAGVSPIGLALLDAYAAREQVIRELEDVRRDQASKEALIARISRELEDVRADQTAKEELIARVDAELVAVRADQSAKERVIERLERELRDPRSLLRATLGRE